MKSKLPRKRKKAYIKKNGPDMYRLNRLVNDYAQTKWAKNKFPKTSIPITENEVAITSYW